MFRPVFALAFISTALCSSYKYEECFRLDGDVHVTFSVSKDGKVAEEQTISLDNGTVNGTCANGSDTLAAMRIRFSREIEWDLIFDANNGTVELDQLITFVPAQVFNSTFINESLDLLDVGKHVLSKRDNAYKCNSDLSFAFFPENKTSSDGRNYSATLVLSNLIVQAFGLENGNYTTADTCEQDFTSPEAGSTEVTGTSAAAGTTEATTEAPTTEAPTEAPTTVAPPPVTPDFPNVDRVNRSLFEVKDKENVTCFRLEAGLQLVVEYNATNGSLYTRPIHLTHETTKVNGSCSSNTTTAVMIISTNDTTLTITETKDNNSKVATQVHLEVVLDNTTFPNASDSGKKEFYMTGSSFELDTTETYYRCSSLQKLRFYETNTTLVTNDVRLQSFGLNGGNFTGEGVDCSLDPGPPAGPAAQNTYVVNSTFELCIVFQGKISFDNLTYTDNTKKMQTKSFSIPAINGTDVTVNGSCGDSANSTEETLVITFNKNWTLTLTFAESSPKEYSLRDIDLVYYLGWEYFPNVSEPGLRAEASMKNLTGFLKGNGEGSAYKCNAEVTQDLNGGVKMRISELQYKAFNKDFSESFNNVSECSDDDESNSIVPIAVGAALAGLVVIVLIAYLIGRRRSRRQGYESV